MLTWVLTNILYMTYNINMVSCSALNGGDAIQYWYLNYDNLTYSYTILGDQSVLLQYFRNSTTYSCKIYIHNHYNEAYCNIDARRSY